MIISKVYSTSICDDLIILSDKFPSSQEMQKDNFQNCIQGFQCKSLICDPFLRICLATNDHSTITDANQIENDMVRTAHQQSSPICANDSSHQCTSKPPDDVNPGQPWDNFNIDVCGCNSQFIEKFKDATWVCGSEFKGPKYLFDQQEKIKLDGQIRDVIFGKKETQKFKQGIIDEIERIIREGFDSSFENNVNKRKKFFKRISNFNSNKKNKRFKDNLKQNNQQYNKKVFIGYNQVTIPISTIDEILNVNSNNKRPNDSEEKQDDKEEKQDDNEEKQDDKEEKQDDKEEKQDDNEEKQDDNEEKQDDNEEKQDDNEEKQDDNEEKQDDNEEKQDDNEEKQDDNEENKKTDEEKEEERINLDILIFERDSKSIIEKYQNPINQVQSAMKKVFKQLKYFINVKFISQWIRKSNNQRKLYKNDNNKMNINKFKINRFKNKYKSKKTSPNLDITKFQNNYENQLYIQSEFLEKEIALGEEINRYSELKPYDRELLNTLRLIETDILMIKLFKVTFEDILASIDDLKLTPTYNQFIDLDKMEVISLIPNTGINSKRNPFQKKKGVGSMAYLTNTMANFNQIMESKIDLIDELVRDINWILRAIGIE